MRVFECYGVIDTGDWIALDLYKCDGIPQRVSVGAVWTTHAHGVQPPFVETSSALSRVLRGGRAARYLSSPHRAVILGVSGCGTEYLPRQKMETDQVSFMC